MMRGHLQWFLCDHKQRSRTVAGGCPGTMGNALRPPAISYRRRSRTNGPTPTPRAGPAPRAPHEGAPVAAPNEDHPQATSSGGHSTANCRRSVQDRAFGDGRDSRTPGPRSVGGLAMGRLTQVHPWQPRFAAMVSRSKSVAGRHRAQRAKILGVDARRTGRASAAR